MPRVLPSGCRRPPRYETPPARDRSPSPHRSAAATTPPARCTARRRSPPPACAAPTAARSSSGSSGSSWANAAEHVHEPRADEERLAIATVAGASAREVALEPRAERVVALGEPAQIPGPRHQRRQPAALAGAPPARRTRWRARPRRARPADRRPPRSDRGARPRRCPAPTRTPGTGAAGRAGSARAGDPRGSGARARSTGRRPRADGRA